MKGLLPLLFLVFAPLSLAAELPYDEQADAAAQVSQALAAGKQHDKPTLLIFGANWCGDSIALDKAMRAEQNAPLVQRFEVVTIDIGRRDRNLELNQAYGDPIKHGIPAVVVVSPEGKVIHDTGKGELARARTLSDDDIHAFLQSWLEPGLELCSGPGEET